MTNSKHSIKFIYDKDCYLCSNFQEYVKLKKTCDISFIDMRENSGELEYLKAQGFDIEHGMIVEIDGRIFQGKEALKKIESMLHKSSWFDKIFTRCMQNPIALAIGYPIAKIIRKILLALRKYKK